MAESTRDRILDRALRAYGTDGFAATSLDALATDLGIRKQTILYYFPTKQAVFEAVVDRAATDLVKVFDQEASSGDLSVLGQRDHKQVEKIRLVLGRLVAGQVEIEELGDRHMAHQLVA